MDGNLYAEWMTARLERERALARTERRARLTEGAPDRHPPAWATPGYAARRPVGRAIGAALAQLAWRERVA